jgi:hypothetical protein
MEPVGGYFELELRKGEHYHKDAIRLNTARNCFEYVLRSRQYTQVYVPYYTCEVLLEPIKKLGVNYKFYSINEQFEPISLPSLDADTAFLYTNYYGMKQKCVERLSEKYGSQLIVDNAQAFYSEPMQRIDTFYSARKFFGVSDGAYLYTGKRLEQNLYQDVSYKRMSHLLKRIDLGAELGYLDFRNDDDMLCNQDIKQMSKLTDNVLSGIDYEAAKRKRRENYTLLDEFLRASNQISLELDERAVPMVYPYLTDDLSLRRRLIENKVFVATYWSNVKGWTTEDMLERKLMERLIPIPCDQRYGEKEMSSIVSLVLGTR